MEAIINLALFLASAWLGVVVAAIGVFLLVRSIVQSRPDLLRHVREEVGNDKREYLTRPITPLVAVILLDKCLRWPLTAVGALVIARMAVR
jgi:hypothetical protein